MCNNQTFCVCLITPTQAPFFGFWLQVFCRSLIRPSTIELLLLRCVDRGLSEALSLFWCDVKRELIIFRPKVVPISMHVWGQVTALLNFTQLNFTQSESILMRL